MTHDRTIKIPPPSAPAPSGILRVSGDKIVGQDGKPIILRGAGLGGHLNMENFITGFPGHESYMRKELKKVLGQEKYDFFFDKFLEYFFDEKDAEFFSSLGFNCLRVPFNYRHFEDDYNPGVFFDRGFQWLDRVINLCAAKGIYTILDLHAVPGGQNPGWHSDNSTNVALFWNHIEFQTRAVALWEALAERYKGNTWVAGYNPLNEPCVEEDVRLIAWYERVEKAIRTVDPDHILFWDGNLFAADFSHFKEALPNSVYSIHDYSNFGFPSGRPYKGTPEQKDKLLSQLKRKINFHERVGCPIWNGEWGPVYASPDDGEDWESINKDRYRLLKDQLALYETREMSWSIWLYKDIGFQGMVYVSPDTAYMKRLKPFLVKKKRLAADKWGCDASVVADVFQPVEDWLVKETPHILKRYPTTWTPAHHVSRLIRNMLLSEELCLEYAAYFEGLSFDELDDVAASFKFENCVQRQELNETIRPKH